MGCALFMSYGPRVGWVANPIRAARLARRTVRAARNHGESAMSDDMEAMRKAVERAGRWGRRAV